jgi:Lar family restriction alleviation protein
MTTKTDLKPCPFCGRPEVAFDKILGAGSSFVKCLSCLTRGPVYRTKAEAIKAWNTRPTDVIREAVEEKLYRAVLIRARTFREMFRNRRIMCKEQEAQLAESVEVL